jgi:hypothetical protein
MGWVAVWHLALKQFNAETVEVRLFIFLAAALVLGLVLVGLKHAFRSAEPKSSAPEPMPAPKRLIAAPVTAAVATHEMRVVRQPLIVSQLSVRKIVKQSRSRQQAPRPSLRSGRLPNPPENRPALPPRSPKR